jgi:hypothetical protein
MRNPTASILLSCLLLVPASISATTYHVSAKGNDANDGASPGNAWRTLDRANAGPLADSSADYAAGDSILLRRGDVWTGFLKPKGSGAAGSPIRIDAYGEGNDPIINGNGTLAVIYLYNVSFWEVSNLEITNQSATPGQMLGVRVEAFDCGRLEHIYIKNLFIHDVTGDNGASDDEAKKTGGICFMVHTAPWGDPARRQSWFHDARVEDCVIHNVNRVGISTRSEWWSRGVGTPWVPSTGIVIRNNLLDDIGGDGITIRIARDTLVEYNMVKDANARSNSYACALWANNADGTVFQYNEACLTRTTMDGQGLDIDFRQDGGIFQYNYSHDNEGGFLLVCADGDNANGTNPPATNCIARYNISQNDHHNIITAAGPTDRIQIYNNTIFVPGGSIADLILFKTWNGWAKNWKIQNNIFMNFGSGVYRTDSRAENIVWEANVFYGNHPASEPADARKLTLDPMLAAPGSGGDGIDSVDGYKLRSGSPLYAQANRGVLIENNGGLDYWGNPVSATTPPLRGAYNGGELGWVSASADAYARGDNPSGNFGAASVLPVQLDGANTSEVFFRFNVASLAGAGEIKLVLVPVATGTAAGEARLSCEFVADDLWAENALTWNTKPAGTGELFASGIGCVASSALAIDVTDRAKAEAAGDGYFSVRVAATQSGAGYQVGFGSREHNLAYYRPALVADKAIARVELANLRQIHTGEPRPVTVTTEPANLTVNVTYDGLSSVPSAAGFYSVVVTVNDPRYTGVARGMLEILPNNPPDSSNSGGNGGGGGAHGVCYFTIITALCVIRRMARRGGNR